MANDAAKLSGKPIVWVLGGPGCGKGTQCAKIKERYAFDHISTGDLLRAEIKAGTARGKCCNELVEKGELIPNEVMLEILHEAIMSLCDHSKGFLIDGYPRELNQGKAFEEKVAPVTAIIYLETTVDTLMKRLNHRAQTSGRADDNEATIKARVQTFLQNNNQILQLYADKITTINAERDPDSIFADIAMILDPVVAQAQEKLH